MRHAALAIAVAVAGIIGVASGPERASAQSAYSEYVGPNLRYGPKGYYFDDSSRYRGRVYGYTQYYDAPPVVVVPQVVAPRVYAPRYADPRVDRGIPGGCGEYRYWNGDYCADARNR